MRKMGLELYFLTLGLLIGTGLGLVIGGEIERRRMKRKDVARADA